MKRRRYIGGAAALAVAGALTMGFMTGGTAMAEGEGDQVVFNGKCGAAGLGLGNKSVPDKADLSVTSGDKVTFTNNLGTEATLHIGSTESKIEKGDSKTVKLSNNTEAKMSPKCPLVLKDHSETTTVTVQPRQQDPGSGDSDGGSDNGDGQDDGSSSGGSSGGDSAAGGSTGADKPDDSPDTGKKPKADGKAGDPNSGDDADKAEKQDDEALAPGDTGGDDAESDTAKVDATNKVSNENSASGLLAALAALCLAGVGFAAIRTFFSGRAAASA